MKHEVLVPPQKSGRTAAGSCNPGPVDSWYGPGLQPSEPAPPPPGRLERIVAAAACWLQDWHEDLIIVLTLFMGAYLILMMLAAGERADLLAGWL